MTLQALPVLAKPGPWDDATIAEVTRLAAQGWFFCETDGCDKAGTLADLVQVRSGEFHCPPHANP